MNYSLHVFLAVAAAYGCGLAAIPSIRSRSRIGVAAATGLICLILAAPLLIPSAGVRPRALAMFLGGDLTFRLVDALRYCRQRESGIPWRDFLRFLLPFPVLLVVYRQYQRARRNGTPGCLELPRVIGGAAGLALALLLLFLTAHSATLQGSFLLDHAVKLILFVLAIESIAQLSCGLERLAGFATVPPIQMAFLSRTPAEFWRRYNNRMHAWLHDNVFVPAGGRWRPRTAMCLTLLVSGLLHELAFDIATSHVDGYQLAFFLLQIPGILASGSLERLAQRPGWAGKALAHGLSILWMAGTSIFFFRSLDRIFPLVYVSQPWLP